MKVKRALAYPLAVGAEVPLLGRVKECSDLIEPGSRLLDIGCSSGWLAPIALSRGYQAYVGLDRVFAGARERSGVTFVAGSVLSLPFSDGVFDAVCLFDVVEHLPRGTEDRALREAHRVLCPGGKLYFSIPHASPLHTPLDPVWVFGHRHYRRRTINRMIQGAGFRVNRLFAAGGIVECLDHLRLLTYKHVLHRQRPSIDWINRLIERSHGHNQSLGMTIFASASRS